MDYTDDQKFILVQYAIEKYKNEKELLEKLKNLLDEKNTQRIIDTLIGTQRVRRIGPDTLENNQSHTELAALPDNLKPVIEDL